MERIAVQATAERLRIEPEKATDPRLDKKALHAWRRRGRIESKIVFLLTLAIFISGLAAIVLLYSKTAPVPGARPAGEDENLPEAVVGQESEPEIAWLSSQLGLTEAQTRKIEPIVEDEERKIDLTLREASLSSEARIHKVDRIRLETLARVAPLLNGRQGSRLHALQQQEETQSRAIWNLSAGAEQGGDE